MVDRIVNRYQLKSLDIEVNLFRAKDDENSNLTIHLEWKKAAFKGVKVHDIPRTFRIVFTSS